MMDQRASIETFLAATASLRPMPAGGSCAALAGALAAALGEMVMGISAGKNTLSSFHARQRSQLERFAAARQTLTRLFVDDQNAFAALLAARRLSRDDPNRPAALEQAVVECIRVPQSLASTAVQVLESCDLAVEMTHTPLLADLSASADLAMATVRIAVNLVRVNAKEIPDTGRRAVLNTAADEVLHRAIDLIRNLTGHMRERETRT